MVCLHLSPFSPPHLGFCFCYHSLVWFSIHQSVSTLISTPGLIFFLVLISLLSFKHEDMVINTSKYQNVWPSLQFCVWTPQHFRHHYYLCVWVCLSQSTLNRVKTCSIFWSYRTKSLHTTLNKDVSNPNLRTLGISSIKTDGESLLNINTWFYSSFTDCESWCGLAMVHVNIF